MHLKKWLVNLLKFGLSLAIIAYLLREAQRDQSFALLRDQPKHWGLLSVALALALSAVCFSFIRWYLLVRALDLPFRLKDAFRLGFLGYLLNFISVGSVGGDLFKAVFIAREQRGRKTEAVATVVIDRLVGMYALFLMAATAVLATGMHRAPPTREIEIICRAALIAAALGTLVVAVLLVPAVTSQSLRGKIQRLPAIGSMAASVVDAVRVYRSRLPVLVVCGLISWSSQIMMTIAIWLIAQALPGKNPTLSEHFVIIPLGMVAGALPLPLGALGAFEFVIDFLYREITGSTQGFVVALGYRLITVVIAMVGAGFYLTSRREMAEVLHEAEEGEKMTG